MMSEYGELLISLMPSSSGIHGSPFEEVIKNSIGLYLDELAEEFEYVDQSIFLTDSADKYMDLWGRVYDLPRNPNEDDESYLDRLVFEATDRFNGENLYNVYGVDLYCHIDDFDEECQLPSDNIAITNKYMCRTTNEIKKLINKKFPVGGIIEFLD